MKRFVSYALALCLMVSMLASIGLTAMAEPSEQPGWAVNGFATPTAGGAVVTSGLSGLPTGWDTSIVITKYDYANSMFGSYDAATYQDNAVYSVEIQLVAQGDAYIPWEQDYLMGNATINGEAFDEWSYVDSNENGYTYIVLEKNYLLGNIRVIDEITIESLAPVAAGTATADPVGLPANAPYTFQMVEWYVNDPWEPYTAGTLADGVAYSLDVELQPKEGYWFTLATTVNAPMEPNSWHYNYSNAFYFMRFDYDLRPVVKSVQLSGIADPVYGAAITDPTVTIPMDANYTVDAEWKTWDSESACYVDADGTFGYGEYTLMVTLTPKAGYTFDNNNFDAVVDGTHVYDLDAWNYEEQQETQVILSYDYELEPANGYIHYVELLGAPDEIVPGAAALPAITTDTDGVTVTDVRWLDAIGAPLAGNFEEGKAYHLQITVEPEDGYAIDEWADIQVVSDEGLLYVSTALQADGTATATVRYSLEKPLDEITVTVTEPTVGGTPAEPTVPADAKYTIAHVWTSAEDDDPVTVFENGKKYYLEISVQPNEGYCVNEKTDFAVNGKWPYYYDWGTTGAYLVEAYSFKAKIDKVELTMPTPTMGGEGKLSDIRVPDGAKYAVDGANSQWYSYDTNFDGTFGKDKYNLDLYLTTASGYEFAENAKLYLNGELYDDYYVFGTCDVLNMYYSVSFRDVIDAIAFPALPTVAVGQDAPDVPVDVPANAKYSLWYEWVELLPNAGSQSLEDAFENDGVYYLFIYADADVGYEFAEDLTVTVGGQPAAGCAIENDDDTITLRKTYVFSHTVIDKVELTIQEPVDGKEPETVTVPANAGYEVESVRWYTYDSDNFDPSENMGRDATFQTGMYHWVSVVLLAKDGYVLSDELTYVINGKTVDPKALAEDTYLPSNMADYADISYGFGKLVEAENDDKTPDKTPDKDPDKTPNKDTHAGKSPLTGDTVPMTLCGLLALSVAGLAVTVLSKKKTCR